MDLSSLVGVIIQGRNSANGRGILTDTMRWENFISFTVFEIKFYGKSPGSSRSLSRVIDPIYRCYLAAEDLFRDHRNGYDQMLCQRA